MSFLSRVKHWFGGGVPPPTITVVTGTTTIYVPDSAGMILFSGSADALATMNTNVETRGGRLLFLYSKDGNVVLKNTEPGSQVAGNMDLGGSDITLGATDMLALYLRTDGVWVRVAPVANN